MQMRYRRMGTVVGVFAVLAPLLGAQSGRDAFVGTWVLDINRSTFVEDTAVPNARMTTFELVGDGLRQIVETTIGNGLIDRTEYSAKFDGKDYPISNSSLDFVSLKRVAPRKMERLGKRRATGDKIVETSTREVSADGRTLTITSNGIDSSGREYRTLQIYMRSEGKR